MLTLELLNAVSPAEFVRLIDGAYANTSWIAESICYKRPFVSLAALKQAMADVVRNAAHDAQLKLVNAFVIKKNSVPCQTEPDKGLEAMATIQELIAAYQAQFGFPLVLSMQGPRGTNLDTAQIIANIELRFGNHQSFEFAEALRQTHRIAELWLDANFGFIPSLGNQIWDWAEQLAQYSDPGYAERGELTVTYLTEAHRTSAKQLAYWMREECGFDSVEIDAVGNVVGIYHSSDPYAPRLLTGSHYDTVRNGGKYDGRLGIFVPMACVHELKKAGRRLPFGLEVVCFAEEEGQRYKTSLLGSGALTGHFEMAWLDQKDIDGISMRQAMANAGLCVDDIPKLVRDASNYLGFVEVHIEQGPVLNELDLPLGIVSSINGHVRYVGEIVGMASHAGTTPMNLRRDAAVAAAEMALYLEQRAASVPNLVGTVGILEVPGGSMNVVPGRCRFSLDIRATTDEVRDACVTDVLAQLKQICERRGLRYSVERIMCQAAAPSAPEWQRRWEQAVESLGLPPFCLPSGAVHDATKMHEVMPQAMLFVRGLNAGISHNPLEGITNNDAELCARAFQALLDQLARE